MEILKKRLESTMSKRSIVIGITGGISTGKSTFGKLMQERTHASLFDADRAARVLTDRDPEVKDLLREQFGGIIFKSGEELGRTSVHILRRTGKEARARANPASAHPPSVGH
jgi:dephospho-CoA kinase